MGEPLKELTDVNLQDIRMGIPSAPANIPTTWTPHPEDHHMYNAERTRYIINRDWEEVMLHSNMRTFDYSNILPMRGPIVAGVSITHRPRPNFGPQLEFGDDCKSIRPRCPTCTEMDTLAFAGMDAISNTDRDRMEIMVQHLRRRVQHCGWQAARADKLAYNWHREGNNAYLMMHHFNMAHIEADKMRRQQPPISRPPPRVTIPDPYQSPPDGKAASTPAVTVTRITQV